MGPFVYGYWEEKYCLLVIEEMSRKVVSKKLKSRSKVVAGTLELIKKQQGRTQESVVYLRDDGAKDYKKRKYCKTFYAKRESVTTFPKDTARNQMDCIRDSTSPSSARFAACLSMQT
jgi:hypothetical protein